MAEPLVDRFAPREVEVEPLPPEVAAALTAVPDAEDVPLYRRRVLARVGKLARVQRHAERAATASTLSTRALAELWAWCAYLEHVRGYRGETTVAQYARSMLRLFEWAHATERDYAELGPPAFDAWQKHLALELRHSPRWRMRQVCAARSFFEWRSSRGMGRNVAANLRGPREPIGMAKKYSVAQLKALLAITANARDDVTRMRDTAILLVLLSTGARREELGNLSLSQLHIGRRSGLVRFHGKGAKEREVPFEGPVVDTLRSWLLLREELPFPVDPQALFVTLDHRTHGQRMSALAIERLVSRYAKAAGLREWGVHRFRVTFATALYDDGNGIEEIRQLMGHERIETTRRYLAVSERTRRTRLRADRQHEVLGTRNVGQPRWLRAALGGGEP